jgi:hypothetical protein
VHEGEEEVAAERKEATARRGRPGGRGNRAAMAAVVSGADGGARERGMEEGEKWQGEPGEQVESPLSTTRPGSRRRVRRRRSRRARG